MKRLHLKIMTFLTDDDGLSAKDYLMIAFTAVFIIEQAIAFILATKGPIPPDLLEVISTMDGIVMTIIGGVFSIQVAQVFKKTTHKADETDNTNNSP